MKPTISTSIKSKKINKIGKKKTKGKISLKNP
jgi:hypothetical protein